MSLQNFRGQYDCESKYAIIKDERQRKGRGDRRRMGVIDVIKRILLTCRNVRMSSLAFYN